MSGFVNTLAALGGDGVRVVYGNAYWDGQKWWLSVGGNQLDARWLDPIQPLQGGKVVAAIVTDGRGQSSALVLGGYTDQPRPSTGTVKAVTTAGVGNLIEFEGIDGVRYTTDRFIGSYNFGDIVLLDWTAGKAAITGVVHTNPPPPPAQPPAPPAQINPSGYETLTAKSSDTYTSDGWGSWAGSTRGGEKVYAGDWAGYTVTGAWFYGAPPAILAGKTITKIQFRIPARLKAGDYYNNPATLHLYAHTAVTKPGGDVPRVVGPFSVTVPGRAGAAWVDLPTSFGAALANGGGISISGNPYMGFAGRLDDPQSGKLIIDWQQT